VSSKGPGQQYARIARCGCRTEVESKAARVSWVEEQALHLQTQRDDAVRARQTPQGNAHRTRLHVHLLCKACDLEQKGAHAERVQQRVCDLKAPPSACTVACVRHDAPGWEQRTPTYAVLLGGPSTGCLQPLLQHTPPAHEPVRLKPDYVLATACLVIFSELKREQLATGARGSHDCSGSVRAARVPQQQLPASRIASAQALHSHAWNTMSTHLPPEATGEHAAAVVVEKRKVGQAAWARAEHLRTVKRRRTCDAESRGRRTSTAACDAYEPRGLRPVDTHSGKRRRRVYVAQAHLRIANQGGGRRVFLANAQVKEVQVSVSG
jgi:hypothetical protein